ncbi:uncharacterized protein LODBEIA_P15930 [Lodderomyces beijingensis]|uniref:Uncharacterized protein n=1 Tax=Lodderomyces beijingensis TaxID=1775926 RepID=A0ABP0ZHL1_9ASCO
MATKVISKQSQSSPSRANSTKQKLALFSFGSEDLSEEQPSSQNSDTHNIAASDIEQASSLSNQPFSGSGKLPSLESKDSCIFERDCCFLNPQTDRSNSISSLSNSFHNFSQPATAFSNPSQRSRSSTHNSSISMNTSNSPTSNPFQTYFKHEDLIPPALDATAHILNKEDANLDNVNMVYSSRRSSSVVALNMALGRPMSPASRKNSIYNTSFTQLDKLSKKQSDETNSSVAPASAQLQAQSPAQAQAQSQPQPQAQAPTSPLSPSQACAPQLKHSKSQVNFYSYAEMINEESQTLRRPTMSRASVSQGMLPTLRQGKFSTTPRKRNTLSYSNSLKGKSLNQSAPSAPTQSGNLYKCFIKSKNPKDDDDNVSDSNTDNESLISCSVADCIRGATTEISGH